MHTGTYNSIEALGVAVKELAAAQRDYVLDTRALKVATSDNGGGTLLTVGTDDSYFLTPTAERQVLSRLGIPKRYADRLHENHAALWDANVNYLLHREPEQRMVRCYDQTVATPDPIARAFLSNRYRILDYAELFEYALMPVLRDRPDLQILQSDITPDHLYVKVTTPRVRGEVPHRVGDVVQGGVIVRSSETGLSRVMVQFYPVRLACLNGMVVKDMSLAQVHLGAAQGSDDTPVHQLYKDETLKQDDLALWMKVRDMVEAMTSPERFNEVLEIWGKATQRVIETDLAEFGEDLAEVIGLSEVERKAVMQNLVEDGDLTQYGAAQAVTALANTTRSADRAVELQEAGYDVITWTDETWEKYRSPALHAVTDFPGSDNGEGFTLW